MIPTKYKDLHHWADCADWLIQFVQQTDKMHIVAVRAIVELVHLVWENAASDRTVSIWYENNHLHLETYCIEY